MTRSADWLRYGWLRIAALLAVLLLVAAVGQGQLSHPPGSGRAERALPQCGEDRIFNQGAQGTWDHGRLDCLGAADNC
jgi:hypothetical protein